MTMPATVAQEPAFCTRVRLRARRYAARLRHAWANDGLDPGQGLAITHTEVDRALFGASRLDTLWTDIARAHDPSDVNSSIEVADSAAANDPSIAAIGDAFALSQPEIDLLSMVLAGEIDPAMNRVYGYLHDDAHACHATLWLAAQLFDWPVIAPLGPQAPLVRWRLAQPIEGDAGLWSNMTRWKADPHIAAWALGISSLDPALGTSVSLLRLEDIADLDCLYPEQFAEMLDFVLKVSSGERSKRAQLELEIVGADGTGRRTLGAQVASALGRPLLVADAGELLGSDVSRGVAIENGIRVVRLARLLGSIVYWRGGEQIPTAVRQTLPPYDVSIVGCAAPTRVNPSSARRGFVLPPILPRQRAAIWERLTGQSMPEAVGHLALAPGEIMAAAASVNAGPEALIDVCQQMLQQTPGELFSPLACPYTWDDIVLTAPVMEHLREIESHFRLRGQVLDNWGFAKLSPLSRGLTALFAGPSGTGKTMAAQILARALGVELYRVDLAGVVNKYIGETEKRLKQVFDACERANVLLFFDEADALFGQRTQVRDAHDRFANIEIDYLLQRMEQFNGIAILATNRKNDIDKAFLRRLRFIVDFPPPGEVERAKLWKLSLLPCSPNGEQLLDRIDWKFLAEKLLLTGAEIKNAALAAAFLACGRGTRIGMPQILAAARRELTKQGSVLRPGEWEA